MVDLERIYRKLRLLMRLMKSPGTPAEAQAAAGRIAALCDVYRIDISTVHADDLSEKESIAEFIFVPERAGIATGRVETWLLNLSVSVAYAHHSKALIYDGSNMIRFVGLKYDAIACVGVMTMLVRSARLYFESLPNQILRWEDYAQGFAEGVARLYEKQIAEACNKALMRIVDVQVENAVAHLDTFRAPEPSPLDFDSYLAGYMRGLDQELIQKSIGGNNEQE